MDPSHPISASHLINPVFGSMDNLLAVNYYLEIGMIVKFYSYVFSSSMGSLATDATFRYAPVGFSIE